MNDEPPSLSRRDFLISAWAALTAMSAALAVGIGLWHVTPPDDEMGGVVLLDAAPPPDADPVEIPAGRFAWTRADQGVAAISEICPHMGCILAWQAHDRQFECPCHGSRFDAMGGVVQGPADHTLDYLEVTVLDAAGRVVDRTTPEQLWVQVGAGYRYRVNAGKRIPSAGETSAAG